jgi:hypothetical protein
MATDAPGRLLQEERLAVRSPRVAGITGLLFAVLFSVSVVILKVSVNDVSRDSGGGWLAEKASWVTFAIGLMPFAGIFFLWFIGVVRARLGRLEDQFFSAVFLGSGLIFLAMVFVAAGVAGALVLGYARDPQSFAGSTTYYFARDIITQIFSIYALRMAAVFLLSQATLWLRTKVMPRWMAVLTYPVALLLLFVFTQSFWVVLVFPAWVFLVSVYILVVRVRRPPEVGDAATLTTPEAAGDQ